MQSREQYDPYIQSPPGEPTEGIVAIQLVPLWLVRRM